MSVFTLKGSKFTLCKFNIFSGGKRCLAGYVVTGRATPRLPQHIGLTLSDSEEEVEALIQPSEDIDTTSDMSSSEESESDEEF